MKRKTKNQYTISTATIIGLLTSVVLVLLCVSVATTFVLAGKISESILVFLEPGILILSLYTGTWITLKNVSQAYLLVSSLITMSYLAFTAGINIIMFDASFHAGWVEVVMVIIGCGLACLTAIKTTGKTKHRHKYR